MRRFRSFKSMDRLGRIVVNISDASQSSHSNKEYSEKKVKKGFLQFAKDLFESVRSIALSIIIIFGGSVAIVAVGKEVLSDDILIDVTDVSKSIADSGGTVNLISGSISSIKKFLNYGRR